MLGTGLRAPICFAALWSSCFFCGRRAIQQLVFVPVPSNIRCLASRASRFSYISIPLLYISSLVTLLVNRVCCVFLSQRNRFFCIISDWFRCFSMWLYLGEELLHAMRMNSLFEHFYPNFSLDIHWKGITIQHYSHWVHTMCCTRRWHHIACSGLTQYSISWRLCVSSNLSATLTYTCSIQVRVEVTFSRGVSRGVTLAYKVRRSEHQ